MNKEILELLSEMQGLTAQLRENFRETKDVPISMQPYKDLKEFAFSKDADRLLALKIGGE